MTTRLAGAKTRFLPFNRGRDGGAGNPANQAGHRMAYLWRDVWAQDNWLDLLQRFVTAEQPAKGPKTAVEMIFPRFHQWDAVRALEAAARSEGPVHDAAGDRGGVHPRCARQLHHLQDVLEHPEENPR